MTRAALALALLLAACKAQIADSGPVDAAIRIDAAVVTIDAGTGTTGDPGGPAVDAAIPIDAIPIDAAPVCSQRTLFLNFDGQTLSRGTSDATTNTASWLTANQGTAPRYRTGDADRDAKIAAIVAGVRAQLAAFPITVVTTRPTSGEYVMIVLGGKANQIGSRFGFGVNALDCGDVQHNDVGWISDDVTPSQYVINLVIGSVGFGLGLTATTDKNDCMCGWDNRCAPNTGAPCTLGSPATRDPGVAGCMSVGATQDEVATFRTAFCGP